MGADIWLADDVRRILTALSSAGEERGVEYQKALGDVGLAFGVPLPTDPIAVYTIETQVSVAGPPRAGTDRGTLRRWR